MKIKKVIFIIAVSLSIIIPILFQRSINAAMDLPNAKQINIVHIGDSYSAGNGAGSYYGDIKYFRSRKNWGEEYVKLLKTTDTKVNYLNIAQSGNTTNFMLNTDYLDDIPENTDLVMMTIGGNDVNFGDIVKQCFVIGLRDGSTCEKLVNSAKEKLSSAVKGTEEILKKLEDKLSPNSQIILAGYPLLSLDTDYSLATCSQKIYSLCTKWDSYTVAQDIRALGKLANYHQSDLAKKWNNEHDMKLIYVDTISDKFAGHEPNPSIFSRNDIRWINEFFETMGEIDNNGRTKSNFTGTIAEWYYPNITGHQKIAATVFEKTGVPTVAKAITSNSSNIDIVFTIGSLKNNKDYTNIINSINSSIDTLKRKNSSVRYSLVANTSSGSKVIVEFTTNAEEIKNAVRDLYIDPSSGSSMYEAINSGLNLNWRPGVKKMSIIISEENNYTLNSNGGSWQDLAQKSYEIDPVEFYVVSSEGELPQDIKNLASSTGGDVFEGDSENFDYSMQNIANIISTKPSAWLEGPFVIKSGDELTLDASGSYSPGSTIYKYEWDFNGDGAYEMTTSEAEVNYVFDQDFDGFIGVRVTDYNSNSSVASTKLTVSNDGDSTPREIDNCPDIYNYSQSDYDNDGIGDECDPTPGYPTEDKPYVYEIIDGKFPEKLRESDIESSKSENISTSKSQNEFQISDISQKTSTRKQSIFGNSSANISILTNQNQSNETETNPEKSDTSNNQKSENAKEGLENTKDSAQNTDNKAGIILLSIIIVTITSVIIFMFKKLKKN